MCHVEGTQKPGRFPFFFLRVLATKTRLNQVGHLFSLSNLVAALLQPLITRLVVAAFSLNNSQASVSCFAFMSDINI